MANSIFSWINTSNTSAQNTADYENQLQQAQLAQAHQQALAKQQYLSQQGTANTLQGLGNPTHGHAIGGWPTVTTATICGGGGATGTYFPSATTINTGGAAAGYAVTVPHPTGMLYTIAFMDATGQTWAMAVDQAYVPILQQISQLHATQGARNAYNPSFGGGLAGTKSEPIKMLEGDFSECEMELAENIITELNGAKNHGSVEGQPETEGAN